MMSKKQEAEKQLRIAARQGLEVAAHVLRTAAGWRARTDRTPEEVWFYLSEQADNAERAYREYDRWASQSESVDKP